MLDHSCDLLVDCRDFDFYCVLFIKSYLNTNCVGWSEVVIKLVSASGETNNDLNLCFRGKVNKKNPVTDTQNNVS